MAIPHALTTQPDLLRTPPRHASLPQYDHCNTNNLTVVIVLFSPKSRKHDLQITGCFSHEAETYADTCSKITSPFSAVLVRVLLLNSIFY